MRLNNINPDTLSDNLLLQIARNTGIDNFSDSSKAKNISDIIARDLYVMANGIETLTQRMFTDTASDQYLDANGSEYGVYRRIIPNLIITSDDQVAYIRPVRQDVGFPDGIIGRTIISAGDKLELGSRFMIMFQEDVVINAGEIQHPVSIKITPQTSEAGIQINEGDSYRLDVSLNPLLADVQLDFDKPVITSSQVESDIDYRARIILGKNSSKTASDTAVMAAILSIPTVYGYDLLNNSEGTGIGEISIVTKELLEFGSDNTIDSTVLAIKQRLRDIGSGGVFYDISVPKPLLFLVSAKTNTSIVDLDVATDAILKVLKDNYNYNGEMPIIVKTINMLVDELVGDNVIKITKIGIYDQGLDYLLEESDTQVTVPGWGFLFLQRSNIEVEPNA